MNNYPLKKFTSVVRVAGCRLFLCHRRCLFLICFSFFGSTYFNNHWWLFFSLNNKKYIKKYCIKKFYNVFFYNFLPINYSFFPNIAILLMNSGMEWKVREIKENLNSFNRFVKQLTLKEFPHGIIFVMKWKAISM